MRKTVSASLAIALSTAAAVGVAALVPASAAKGGPTKAEPAPYARLAEADKYKAMITRYCVACHNAKTATAGVMLHNVDLKDVPANAELWEKVVKKMRGRMMPPPGMPHPDEATTDGLTGWLEGYLDYAVAGEREPGYVSLHRLNRKEYANAVQYILGVKISPTALLPQDDVFDGFDNVADALQVSPSFLDQYIAAARTVAVQAVGERSPRPASATYSSGPEDDGKQLTYVSGLPMGTRGGLVVEHHFPADGEYEVNIADMVGGLYSLNSEFQHRVLVVLDGVKVYETDIGGDEDSRQIDQLQAPAIEKINSRLKNIRFKATAGPHKLGVTFLARSFAESDARLQNFAPGGGMDRVPRVINFEVRGPFKPTGLSETPSRQHIFTCYPKAPSQEAACADKIISRIARQAYRRPINGQDMAELRKFYRMGHQRGGFEEGVRGAITRVLASPEFLYRVEQDPAKLPAGAVHRLSDLELASRLSFFLWSNVPDDELLDIAAAGKLSKPGVMEAQVKRMLADPRADTLVTSFAFQWLQVAKLDDVAADAKIFPNVAKQRDSDGDIRASMKKELQLFISDIFRKDRSVVDLLTADDTYLNERLALHYGINDIKGPRFRHVKLPMQERHGLLGKGAVLMQTSYPNRTSPVLRGAWILENIIGTPPNPPPPGVEALKEPAGGQTVRTMRQRMAEHRANPSCNVCHGVMDPLGLSLENFDAVGVWRARDRFAASDIDASGVLPTGAKINGPNDLRNALAARPNQFAQTFTQKLMTYALGRRVEYRDMPTVRAITAKTSADNYRFSSIVMAIVDSDQFRMRAKPAAPAAKPDAKVQIAAQGAAAPARP